MSLYERRQQGLVFRHVCFRSVLYILPAVNPEDFEALPEAVLHFLHVRLRANLSFFLYVVTVVHPL